MEVNSAELISILKDKIVLYEHLGIEVKEIHSGRVRFLVSLEKSRNHKGTAFGGSLYATAVLGAYALVLAGLQARKIPTENIVIAKGEIEYLRPVDTDFEVVCEFPSAAAEEDFFKTLVTDGRTKGSLKSHILAVGGSRKASLTGLFVVKL